MSQRYRIRAEFDVVVPTGAEDAATQLGEGAMSAFVQYQVNELGHTIQTGSGSPDVAVRSMLDNPPQRGTILATALFVLGQQSAGEALKFENLNLTPVSQSGE